MNFIGFFFPFKNYFFIKQHFPGCFNNIVIVKYLYNCGLRKSPHFNDKLEFIMKQRLLYKG